MTGKLAHFLLVEDNDDHALLITRNLERARVKNRVDRVSDGEQALAYLRQQGAYGDCPRPDVVLLDLKLPKLDGLQVLERMKEDELLNKIPVVVLTTSNAETDRTRAYERYVNSYLVKPIDFENFRQLISDLGFYWGVWNSCAD